MDAIQILTTLGGIFGLISIAGGAMGYLKASRGDTIIKYQTVEIELRDRKIAVLEKDNASVTAERERLLQENAYLKDLAQGSPELRKLTAAIENQTRVIGRMLDKRGGE